MIIDTETKRKLREMNATDLLDAFERLDEQTTMPLSHAEVIRLAVDSAHSGHMDARIQRLVKRCFASMFVRQVRQCFSVVWADGFPRCRHRFPVM